MYQKYNTEAIVLQARERCENDRVFALYTKDFGLVQARASAVRREGSRMRYALQTCARADVSLVRGKRGWRVAGAASRAGAPKGEGAGALARIAELTLRLVNGEERNDFLFASLADAHEAFAYAPRGATATIEIVCVARILYALGYISNEALSMAIFTHTAYTGESLLEAETMKDKLLASINRAISETHL